MFQTPKASQQNNALSLSQQLEAYFQVSKAKHTPKKTSGPAVSARYRSPKPYITNTAQSKGTTLHTKSSLLKTSTLLQKATSSLN